MGLTRKRPGDGRSHLGLPRPAGRRCLSFGRFGAHFLPVIVTLATMLSRVDCGGLLGIQNFADLAR